MKTNLTLGLNKNFSVLALTNKFDRTKISCLVFGGPCKTGYRYEVSKKTYLPNLKTDLTGLITFRLNVPQLQVSLRYGLEHFEYLCFNLSSACIL